MTTWLDPRTGRYRATLPLKIAYGWAWPLVRRVMFRLPCEAAHHWAIRGIAAVALVDRVWSVAVAGVVIALVVMLRLAAFLPGCRWQPEPTPNEEIRP